MQEGLIRKTIAEQTTKQKKITTDDCCPHFSDMFKIKPKKRSSPVKVKNEGFRFSEEHRGNPDVNWFLNNRK